MYEQILTSLSSVKGSLWRETKKLLQYKRPSIPLKKTDNSFAFSDNDKAEVFKAHLHETSINQPEKYFTSNEVKQTIQKYSLKKSPGFDLITAEVARCLPKKAIVLLTYIFNAIYSQIVIFSDVMEIL